MSYGKRLVVAASAIVLAGLLVWSIAEALEGRWRPLLSLLLVVAATWIVWEDERQTRPTKERVALARKRSRSEALWIGVIVAACFAAWFAFE